MSERITLADVAEMLERKATEREMLEGEYGWRNHSTRLRAAAALVRDAEKALNMAVNSDGCSHSAHGAGHCPLCACREVLDGREVAP